MAAAAILNVGKMSIFGLDKDILHQIIWEDASGPCGDDHVTKSRNRKLVRVTSSNEGLKHMCVDFSDYNRYKCKKLQFIHKLTASDKNYKKGDTTHRHIA